MTSDLPNRAGQQRSLTGRITEQHTFWNPDPASARYVIVMSARTSMMLDALHGGGNRSAAELSELFAAYGCELLG